MSNLVFIHNGKVWRVVVNGDMVTLSHDSDVITFINVGELKKQIKYELEKRGK